MDITTRYNHEKETTIQYDITELLHDDLSDYVKHKLERSNEDEVKKFLSLFPLISQVQIKEIRRLQNAIKKCFPVEIYEDNTIVTKNPTEEDVVKSDVSE